ncbi:hypothetical protein MSPP1_000519 [Malassezia sp. CBS 17886]|nr:hypothetical protein MSPP1_000519 [Malassezia sp. CBS 17886]
MSAYLDEHVAKPTGREAVVERRRARAADHRAMSERRDMDDDVADGLSEDVLLGRGGSFEAARATSAPAYTADA